MKSKGRMVFITPLIGLMRNVSAFTLRDDQTDKYLIPVEAVGWKNYFQMPSLQEHASAARLLPCVFSHPCQYGFNLKPLCVPSLLFPPLPSSVHLARSWRTGLKLCPSTRSWGSPCQLNWMNCTRVWVCSTGLKTAPQPRVQISPQPQQWPVQTLPARQTMAPRTCASFLTPLNCCTKTAFNPSHIRTG